MHVPQMEGGYSDNDPIVDDFDDFVSPSSGPWNSVAVQNRTVTDTMPMSGLTKGGRLHYIRLYADNCYNGTDVTFDKLDKDFENLEPGDEKGTNDWSDPNMMEMVPELFENLTTHLRAEKRWLQLGFGFWSNFHVSRITMKPGVNFPTAEQIDTLFSIVKAHRGTLQVAVSVGVGDDEGYDSAYETKLYNGCNYDERVYTMKGGEFSNGEGTLDSIMDMTKQLMKKRAMHYIMPNGTSEIMSSSSSKVQELSAYMGYRLKVASVDTISDGYTRLMVTNVGIGPTLYDLNVVHENVTFEPALVRLNPGASRYVYGKIIVGDNASFEAEGSRYLGGVKLL
ncbi:hypothetical protein SARC_03822 [Sphaeroforma arctica JP610]|uniref:Uncharacterized protein n=1 Tax=Sphaeroforma arctica JP610 TaxID=667725 RepID=A0A0L0G6U7_9EUKA|nr:hypothetical protein SARC_03822 [Sphaeroforma arctica JP610]KNC83958.1 hypothetical protein SARC_03822 [Sphaeroforma arctica JP610]|eukprot:XP_014157860.1 hypothetical protein SARC_03822 [Sphaeroforma arctica JP610]